jgi:hypothetical protein
VPQRPTRPATTTYHGTKQLTPQPRGAAPEPPLTDTPRHHGAALLRTGPLTWLPDYRTTQTGASLRLGAQSLRPSPASTTNPHRQSHTTRDLHAPKAHNLRRRRSPLPAREHQIASASSFRPKLQPSPQSGVRPPGRPTGQDSAWTLEPLRLGLRRSAFQSAVHSTN